MSAWKENPHAARIDFHLLHIQQISQVSFPTKFSRQEVRAALRRVAKHDAPIATYVEGEIGSSKAGQKIGCLLLGHERTSGEPGYYAAILTEEAFPSCGYVSIAPPGADGKAIVSELTKNGWHDLPAAQAGNHSAVLVALTALNNVPDSQGTVRMRVENIYRNPDDEPPNDIECRRRLALVMRGKMPLTKATVAAGLVRLFDPNFSPPSHKELVSTLAATLVGERKELVVYWDGTQFISSDDYCSFRAYQSFSAERLPVVIMGNFPQEHACVEQRGKQELPPPLLVVRDKVMPGATKELVAWQMEQASLQDRRLPPPSDLMSAWILFAELLADEHATEKELHRFLDENPLMMGAHWDSVEAEIRFARLYKADFVLRAIRALPTVRLVELERASHRLFTKDLHETDEVTHAVQQVSDWMRWWRQNPEHSVVAPSRGVDPDGLVVIGRSTHLSNRERETLAHNNQRRNIKVITYDELLDDFGSLILHRLDDTRS